MQGTSAAYGSWLLAENCQQQFGARLKCLGWLNMRFLTSLPQVVGLGRDVRLPGKTTLPFFAMSGSCCPRAAFTDTQRRELP